MQAIGVYSSLAHSTSVTADEFRSTQHMLGLDLERIAFLSSSGEDLSASSVILLKCKNFGDTPSTVPTKCLIASHFDRILSVSDTICEIFD